MKKNMTIEKKEKRGGWRNGGRPKKFGADIETTIVSIRVPSVLVDEVKEKLQKIAKEIEDRFKQQT